MGRKKTSSKKKAIATAASYEGLTADERKAKALEFKTIGNTAFAAGNYAEAKKAFSECIAIEPTEQVYYSNRSATYVALNKLNSAIEDGKECVKLAPGWWKGYSRLATAYQGKGKWEQAIKTFALGVNVDPAQDTIRNQLNACMKAAETEWDEKSLSNLMGNLHIADKPITQDDENFSHVIGIDLGTTYSCVGVFKDGNVEIIANSEGQRTTPSVVSFSGDERLIGDAAKSSAPSNPLNTVYDAKRMIGSTMDDEKVIADVKHFPFEVKEGDSKKPVIVVDYQGEKREFSPEEISAMVLTRMKETAEAFLGTDVDKAVVTVPAYFNDSQRVATRNAGTIAGLDVKRIINEPTAAALAYGLDSGDLKGKDVKVLVFDLGGGTFDVSMLRIEGGIFEVLATGGDTHLGGEDFDQNIVNYLADEFNKKNKGKDVKTNARAMKRLKAHAERAKRVLSSATVTHVEIEDLLEGCDFNAALSRAKFENLNVEPFSRCMDAVKNVMKDAKMSVSEVDEIVLVGGSTRIPKVQQNLITFFEGKELNKSINPDEAVAYGAAVQGAILSGIKDPAHSSLLLVDVTPLSLGIEMSGRVMSTIIKRNTAIPVRRTKVYTTEEDYQERVDIPIFEGERACTDGNNKLGDFTISGIQRAKRGVAQIEVTFDLDANGILSVTAKDLVTMASANITITNENRLSEAEIDKMVADAEKYKALDAQHTARVESRNELERLVYNVMEGAKSSKNLDMVTKVSDFRDWLEANPEASSIDLDEKRHQLERIINRK